MNEFGLRGDSGELVNRLAALLEELRSKNYSLYSTAAYEMATRVDALPASWAGNYAELLDPLSGKMLSLIEFRELERSGMSEVFLTKALLQDVSDYLRRRASSTGISQADETRAHFRAQLQSVLSDEVSFARYRLALIKSDPQSSELSDAQVRQEVQTLLTAEVLQDVSLEEAAKRWSDLEVWDSLCEKWLSQELFSEWEDAREMADAF